MSEVRMKMDPIVIIGGGIAGTTCAKTLAEIYSGKIVIITMSHLVKITKNLVKTGKNLDNFDVEEIDVKEKQDNFLGGNVDIIIGFVEHVLEEEYTVIYTNHRLSEPSNRMKYFKLCICSGARPKRFPIRFPAEKFEDRVLFIRDTQTVHDLQNKLESTRRVVIVGNGGIAIELAYMIKKCQIVWVVREDSIGATFFDAGAAKFFLDSLRATKDQTNKEVKSIEKKFSYSATHLHKDHENSKQSSNTTTFFASALGPDWTQGLELLGNSDHTERIEDNLIIEKSTNLHEVIAKGSVSEYGWPIEVKLTNGKTINCDIIVCAIGVEPNTKWIKTFSERPLKTLKKPPFEISERDGGLLIDTQMRTSVRDVYAAGDVVSCDHWPQDRPWLQMRLWTQARQMGHYAAYCISEHIQNKDPSIYFNFLECFTHLTSFFGYKVVLLGCFNAQNLENFEVMVRINPGKDYVKLILKYGRIKGAVLVGETELEETFENLIHNQIDVSRYGEQLLDGTVDIEDYFD